MNNSSIVNGPVVFPAPESLTPENPDRGQMPIWMRLIIAFSILLVLGLASGAVWMVGILMFTFALDGANGSRLPNWLDPFMLVVWPVSIALVPIVPAVLTACNANWKWVIGLGIAAAGFAATVYVFGVVALVSSL